MKFYFKLNLLIFITTLILMANSGIFSQSMTHNNVIKSIKTETDGEDYTMPFINKTDIINIDGILDEYPSYPSIDLLPNNSNSLTLGSIDNSADCSGKIWILTDGECLYIAGDITDDTIINNMIDAQIWDGDAVLFYFGLYNYNTIISPHTVYNTGNEPDYQFGVSCTGLTYLWRWQIGDSGLPIPDCTVSSKIHDNSWTFELKCPFSGLARWADSEFKPQPGMMLPFNIVIQEDDDGGGRDSQLYWMNDPATEYSHENPNLW